MASIPSPAGIRKPAFLAGVFLICFSVLVFQIVQTRILSVISWYYLAFFAISVAMLGMTIGAVWVYVRRERFHPNRLASDLSFYALATAISIRFHNWIWLLLHGVVNLMLGIAIWRQWPLSGLWVIGTFVGSTPS